MMLKIFRSKNTGVQLFWLLLALLLPFPTFLMRGIEIHHPEDASPVYEWMTKPLGLMPDWLKILGFYLLLVWVAFSLSSLWKTLGTGNRNRLVPMFVAILLFGLSAQSTGIHPVLIAMVFFVPAVTSLLKASFSNGSPVQVFNAGFLIAVASIVAYPILLFVPVFVISLAVFRLYKANYWGILMAGMSIPWIYYLTMPWVFSLETEPGVYALLGIYASNVMYFFSFLSSSLSVVNYLIITSLVVLITLAGTYVYAVLDQQIIVIRQLYKSLLWFIIPAFLVMAVSGGMALQSFMVLSLIGAPIVSDYFIRTKKIKLTNGIVLAIMVLTFVSHLLALS